MKKKILLLAVFFWVVGSRPGFAETVCTFTGQVNLSQKQFHLEVDFPAGGTLIFDFNVPAEHHFKVAMILDDVQTGLFTVSTNFLGSLETFQRKESPKTAIRGAVESRYTLINRKPTDDFAGSFEIADGIMNINYLSVGNISVKGMIGLDYPYISDLSLKLFEIQLEEFLSFWAKDEVDVNTAGYVTGDIKLSCPLGRLAVNGGLVSYNGTVGRLEYDSIVLNMEGIYPIIYILNSTVTRTDSLSFKLEGPLDLSNRESLMVQVKSLKKSPLISTSDTTFEWTIIRKQKEGGSVKTELKYLRRKPINDRSLDEESDMLGVERRIEF